MYNKTICKIKLTNLKQPQLLKYLFDPALEEAYTECIH